ncbi:MAG: ferredoxin, partial [Salinivirgaceae bacterium]|nr:ferredoxin [Salinivirgaceae bacterium]
MKRAILLTIASFIGFASCSGGEPTPSSAAENASASVVYFTKEITPEALVRIYKALGVDATGRVAVKISTGESSKSNHLRPELIKDLVQSVGGT